MATGFVQRYRGKIVVRQMWVTSPRATASTSQNLDYDILQLLPASSLAQVFTLPPPQYGAYTIIATSTVATAGTGTRVVNATTGSQIGSTGTTITFSTVAPQSITLIGLSTVLWGISGNSTFAQPAVL